VSENKQQKLPAHGGFYLALPYNIYCLTSVTKADKSHLFSALQPGRPVPPCPPAPSNAHSHMRTRSRQTAFSRLHHSPKRSNRRHTEDRTGAQRRGTRPPTSPWKSLGTGREVTVLRLCKGPTRSAMF